MFELTINGEVYQFNFGMGFMRNINKRVGTPVDGLPDVKRNIGLRYYISGVIDGDIEDLEEVLLAANAGQSPRLTRDLLDAYIDREDTDIDKLFGDVLDFLRSANATKKTLEAILDAVEKQKNKN